MRPACHLVLAILLASLASVSAQARLGETPADLKKRFGRPEPESRANNVFWLFEGTYGHLLYTVTLNPAGRSIAEGLKPVKRARFTEDDALVFIESQLTPWEGSKTMLTLKVGDKYRFAGQDFVCGQYEHVVVDEPNGVLLIWNKATVDPAVMVVSPEMFQKPK